MPGPVDWNATIRKLIERHFPGRAVAAIDDRGTWIHHTFIVEFAGGGSVVVKVEDHPEWGDVRDLAVVCRVLRENELPAPQVLSVDDTRTCVPFPYIIEERLGGTALGELMGWRTAAGGGGSGGGGNSSGNGGGSGGGSGGRSLARQTPVPGTAEDEAAALGIYSALGHLYRRMHAVHNDVSGLWDPEDYRTSRFPISPNDYMYRAEIVEGSGRAALEAGLISRATYERVVRVWAENLDYLKDHQPALVHNSAFPWTIYLERAGEGAGAVGPGDGQGPAGAGTGGGGSEGNATWRVTKLTALGDVLWWDADYDLALLRYPPFVANLGPSTQPHASASPEPGWWQAFLDAYGRGPEPKRLYLYAIMQRLCAAMGVYMEPPGYRTEEWVREALQDVERFVGLAEGGGEG